MPNYKRYEVTTEWVEEETTLVPGTQVFVVTEVANIKDKQTGDVFTHGAYRVRFDGTKAKTKVWFGESAWMNAERYARDAFFALQLGKPVPAR